MSYQRVEDNEPISDQALINKNHALEDEIKNLRARLAEAEELQRAISEGDLDALVIPRPEGELIFTLNSADHAYRVLVETMNEGTATLGFDGTILYCNRRFAELLRMQTQDILSKSIYRFIAPEDAAIFRELLERKKNSGEVKLHATGGKSIPVYLSISSMQAEDSQNAWCIVVTDLTDITEHMKNEEALKKAYEEIQAKSEEIQVQNEELQAQSEELHEANEALLESEERFRTMANAIPQLAWIARADGYIYWYNERWYAYTGTTPEQMEGWGWESVHDPAVLPKVLKHWKASISKGQMFDMEFPLRGADGLFRMFLTRAIPLKDANGRVLQWFGTNTDITERKRAEEALQIANETLEAKVKERTAELEKANSILKEKEELLSNAQELAHIGNWEHNFVTGKLHWSDEMYRIFGLKPQEFEMTYAFLLSHYVHPDDQDYFDNAVKEALNGMSIAIDFRIISDNGEERIVHAKGEVIFDNQNNPVRIRGIIQDITERRKAEETLRQSEERFNLAVKAAQEGVWDWNMETNEVWYSPRYKEMLGYSEDEIENHVSAWLRLLHPDDKERSLQLVDAVMRGERNYELEFRLRHKDGHYLNILSRGYPVRRESDGKIVRIVGTHLDLTERKQAEEEIQNLANIVESSNDAIVTKSLDGIITSWNRGAEQLYGYSEEEVLGKPISILEPPMLHEETRKLTTKIIHGEENKQYETLRIRKDGKIKRVSITLSPVFDTNGILNAISVIARDITKRKEAEEALAKIEIARKQEIHHRIKNNLQVISSLLDLQAEQFRDKECIKDSEVLEALRESQDRVISMALIHEELYKGSGFETLNFSPYLKKLAENIYQTYYIGNNNISLKLDLAENALFDMDLAVPLGMIVNELVTNSFKHAFKGRGSGEIHIKLHREENGECINCINEDCESKSFVLTVSDNGIGIPEGIEIEELDSLGMQLVITLVDQLDGELEIKRDNGTEFTVRFTVPENNNSTKEASLPRMADND